MVQEVEGVVLIRGVGDSGCNAKGMMVMGGGESCQ